MSTPHLDTQIIHAGEPVPRICGAATPPIFQTTVFQHGGGGDYHDIPYPRLSNLPNHRILHEKLAALEGAEEALVTSSGMAAISSTLLAVAGRGGHVLVQDCLYGGTLGFVQKDLPLFGMDCTVIDARDPGSWRAALRPETRAIYTEALTNPLLQVIDHRAVVEFARVHRLVSVIDSTFATPINFRPVMLGYDLSLHSATKYLNGHTDLVAGVVAGKGELVRKTKHLLDHLGGVLDPLGCFLLHRGLKTLAVRMRRHNESAQRIAEFLASHPAVERVNYPGLPSHPQHALARELFAGCSGMLSFEPAGGQAAALRMVDALQLAVHGPSLGGTETLVSLPARLSHASLTPEQRAAMGISDSLVRMSVGLEAPEDLIADLGRALESARR
jgi:cystathionine beta-lyase/cystathionine gamma-synthase